MPVVLIDPRASDVERSRPAPRADSLHGKTVVLLDISKPGGSVFLDRLEALLRDQHGVATVLRESKPTFTKPAPEAVIEKILAARPHAVIEALAD